MVLSNGNGFAFSTSYTFRYFIIIIFREVNNKRVILFSMYVMRAKGRSAPQCQPESEGRGGGGRSKSPGQRITNGISLPE